MSKYSKYSKHSSTNDFLNIVNSNPYSPIQSTSNNNNNNLDFDFTFDIKKFTYWFVLFVIGYIVQPFVVYNLLPTKIQNSKKGKKEDGSDWTPNDFNDYTDNSETKEKLANEANQEYTLNALNNVIGSKISNLFVIAVFTYIFGNWTNNINFENKANLLLMTVGALAGTFGLELLKSAGETDDWLGKIERMYFNKVHFKDFNFNAASNKYMKSIYTIVSIILIIFIIPFGYGIYKSVKGGFILYYIILVLIALGIFVALPLWVKNRISLTPWLRGLAIVTLLLCRFNDKFSFLFGGLAIGFICSESHWITTPDCRNVTPSVEVNVNADTLEISGELTQLTGINSDILNLRINNVQKGDIIKIQMKNGDNNITTLVATYNIPSNGDHVNGEAKNFLIDLTQIPGSSNTVHKYFPEGKYKAEVTITNEGKDPKTSIIESATAINPTQNLIDLADNTYTNLKFYSKDILLNTYTLEYQNTQELQNLKIIVYDANQPFSSMANNHYYVNKQITQFDTITGEKADETTDKKQLLINLFPDDNPDLPLREPTNIAKVGVAICATNTSNAYNKWILVPTYIQNPDNETELISGDLSHTLLEITDTPTEITISNQAVPNQRLIKIDIAGVVNEQILEFAIGKYTDIPEDNQHSIIWSNKYFTNTINNIANVTDGTYSILIDTAKYYDVYGDYSSTQTGMPSYLSADPNRAIFDRSSQIVVRTRVRTDGENPKRWSNYKQSAPYTLEVEESTISGNSANNDVAKLQDDSTNFIVCGSGEHAANITEFVNNMILDGDKYRVATTDDEKRQSNVYRITFTTKKKVGSQDNIIPNMMKIVVFDRDTTPENRMFDNYYTNVFETPRAEETDNPIDLYAAPNTTFENVQDNMVQGDDNHGTKAPVVDGINKLIRDGLTGEVVGEPVDGIRWEIWINIPDDRKDAQLQTQISFAFNNASNEISNWSDWIVFDQIADHKKKPEDFRNIRPRRNNLPRRMIDIYSSIGTNNENYGNYASF